MAHDEKDERIYKVVVMVSEEEQEILQEAAKLRGLSCPNFLRMLGMGDARELGLARQRRTA
jgi:uncharacterized protein (DUF1778 family)